MKKVLVTGATGFIGRHTIPGLLEKGYEVHAASFGPSNLSSDVNYHSCDLLNSANIANLMAEVKPTHLLHFAWYAVPCKYWTSPMNFEWVKASLDLVHQFVLNGGKRVVMAGSCAEYDWSSGICQEGKTPLEASTLYGTCKTSLSQMVRSYANQAGLSQAWGRIFFLYGPHEYPERLVPSIITSLMQKQTAKCSIGTQIRDFMHVEDVANAFVSLLDSQLSGDINIASGKAVTLKEVIATIAKKMNAENKVEYGARPIPASEAPRIEAIVNRLQHELNWKPKYTLDSGLDQTIAWWQEQLALSTSTMY